ncbi:MAG: alpha/beta fold hydrolase [Desulfobacteraceae bacterium]|nr:alpha/beta fold hydrolase [Desulfobacteraceae bacterium]
MTTADFTHLYPFRSNYVTINGLRYHYLDEGKGDPLLMIHGNPTWSFYFRHLVQTFRGHYRVIVPDHIGCGLSDKPNARQYDFRLKSRINDLSALMEHLKLDRPVTLIVHDWGGMIGLGWALRHLDQVKRLIITNTAGFFPPNGKAIPIRLKLLRTPNPIMDWAVLHLNLFARVALYMAPRQKLSADVKKGLIAPYGSPQHRLATLKFVQDIPLTPDDPSGSIVAEVQQHLERICARPTLLIWGAHDFVFDRGYFEEFRRRIPHAQSHWLTEAGHYLLEDAPEKIAGIIQNFLNQPTANGN